MTEVTAVVRGMWYNDALGQKGPDMGGEMYARITPYKMKPGSREAATAKMNELKAEILGLPGMQHFMSAMNEDGSGYIVATVTDKATSESNAERVKAIWANFAEFLEEMPVPQGFDVVAEWRP